MDLIGDTVSDEEEKDVTRKSFLMAIDEHFSSPHNFDLKVDSELAVFAERRALFKSCMEGNLEITNEILAKISKDLQPFLLDDPFNDVS